MTEAELAEIESCIKAISGLEEIPVVFGVDPKALVVAGNFPRIYVLTEVPTENAAWSGGYADMEYRVKVGYQVKLAANWPTDKATAADLHSKALMIRKAMRNIYERQISGESSVDFDVRSTVDQEIVVLGDMADIGTTITIGAQESGV